VHRTKGFTLSNDLLLGQPVQAVTHGLSEQRGGIHTNRIGYVD